MLVGDAGAPDIIEQRIIAVDVDARKNLVYHVRLQCRLRRNRAHLARHHRNERPVNKTLPPSFGFRHVIAAAILAGGLTACSNDADVASHNLSKAADNFEIQRRVVFYNGITGKYILEIEGRCSLGNNDGPGNLSVTCKTGPGQFKKHFLGLSDNVTYFAEQLQSAHVSAYHYRVIFKPQEIVPNVDVRTSHGADQ